MSANIDAEFTPCQGIQILRKGFPVPCQALGQGGAGNILDTLQQGDQPVMLILARWGKANAAIAHGNRGDAIDRGGSQDAIPGRLAIIMGMNIDKARCD